MAREDLEDYAESHADHSGPSPDRRGELRIYLGAAPGVGKTYAALGEARRRLDRGTDVVVGLVETHGRARTAALLDGMEVVARLRVDHRGTELTELDVDAVLARAPEVCVVDELAHSCAPGSRHAKRWEDVEELLAAGIDVISTVNVQHLESLGDVVERITGVRQRETIPDAVVRAADQVEIVDITPEALRRRMAHGNIYKPEKIDASLANYFRTGNLIALRELALLWIADQVDVALQRYRSREHISEVWEARERVVVAVTGGPESATVLRRAARIARRTAAADLLCVHVVRSDGLSAGGPSAATGAELRRLADDVGASFHSLVGDDVPATLLEFAREANATQLVLGTSRRSRWARLVDPGIGAQAVAESGSIDVHLVSHAEAAGATRGKRRWSVPARRHALGWPAALLLPVLATVVGVVLRDVTDLSTDVVLFFLAVVVVALIGGLGPALLAAVFGGVLLNVFLTPPLYTLTIGAPEDVVAILAMVVVALLVALVVDRADRRAAQAATARAEATLLASFARVVIARSDPLPKLLERVREAFGFTAVALLERATQTEGARPAWAVTAGAGTMTCRRPADAEADVEIDEGVHLVGTGRTLTASERALFVTVSGQALLALRNRRIAAEAYDAQRRAEASGLRTALLSAVGHDLRTPLTAIKAASSSLRDPVLRMSTADRQELLATVEESADRLAALVDNLLDSSRLATGAVTPLMGPVGLDEIVPLALAAVIGVDRSVASRLVVEVDETLPEVLADAGLAERVVANLVDNALRHGGGGSVAVRASHHADRVELRVVDEGPGVPTKTREQMFTAFQRLGDRGEPGVGLGLHVARGFTEAMGGSLAAEDTPGGGLTMVLSLPVAAVTVRA